MENIFLAEALKEKMRFSPDSGYIMRMQQHADSDDKLTYHSFVNTGRLMNRKLFLKKYPEAEDSLDSGTTDVMVYIKGVFIEMHGNGVWLTKIDGGRHLGIDFKTIESILWDWVESNFITK